MVILPQFNQPLNTLTISFKYGRGNTSGGYSVKLGYVTSTSATSLTGELTTISEPAALSSHSDFSFTVPSTAPSGTNYRLAIYFTRTNSTSDSWYFDNFSVTYTAPAVPTPITMQCGTTYSGTLGTSGIWNSYPTSSCGWTENGEEKVYAYTPPVTGSYTFYTTNDVGDTDFFLMTSNSNNGTSVGCWSSGEASYTLTGGQTYYLICDNCTGSSSVTYSVQVSCPTCSVNVWTSGGGTVSGSGSYSYNTSCTATATPSSGYVFDRWILNGTQTIITNPYTFTVTGATDLQAVFSTAHSITVSANPSNGGSASGGGTFTSGEICTVTATPNSGYCFNNWTENGMEVSTNATYTFTVSGNRDLVANFASLDANSITVSGNSVVCGNSATLTASGLTGVTYNWYSDAACTQLVQANSATLTTPVLYNNATYYVKAVKGNAWEEVEQFPYTGSEQTYTVPANASYVKMEVWGAQGGYRSSSEYGGKGGYSVGTLTDLNGVQNLYVYVGGSGNTGRTSGGYNGGGSRDNYNGGGGATHIAKRSGLLSSLSSYQSDVLIVAGGGGSDGATNKNGMYGGGETGGSATQSYGSGGGGGSQTAGGVGSSSNTGTNGSFGQGGHGYNASSGYAGAGGGGWYGGAGSYPDSSGDDDRGGGGGSGHLNASLVEAQTIAGNATMPNPSGGDMTGREGNGYALITAFIDERCESEAKAVTVTVTPPDANSITVSGTSVACGNSTTLTAGGLTSVTYNWYSDAACTNLVQANSATLTTPVLTENTTYYVKAVKNNIIEQETQFSYTGSAQSYSIPANAISLKMEVWGAQGGGQQVDGNTNGGVGGKGGYSVGTLENLSGVSSVYVYVGGQGQTSNRQNATAPGGWNGGGTAFGSDSSDPACGGGGATDIRVNGSSLYYRIMVAGGGGGGGEDGEQGGYGGGTTGGTGYNSSTTGGTQTGGGTGYAFGIGASTQNDGGAGGGGWYGGGCGGGTQTIPTSNSTSDSQGGCGGSGYVWTSSTYSSAPSGYSVSSSYYLTDAQTIGGDATMPNPNGGEMTGREGDGYARITAYITEECESEVKAVTVTVSQPDTPSTPVANPITSTTATVTWTGTASSYEYSFDNGAWTSTNSTSESFSGLTPNTSYTFKVKAISGNCESSVVTMSFTTLQQYTVTATASPSGAGSVTGAGNYDAGTNATLTATAVSGYHFVRWTENGSQVGTAGNTTYTINSIAANHDVVAVFESDTYDISYNNVGNGTVTGPASALYGTTVTVTLTEGTGYHLTSITATANGTSIALSGSGNTRTFTMPAGNVNVEATFAIIQYTVEVASLGNGNAHIEVGGTTVSGSSTTVNYGTQVTITATPDSGYSLVNWTNNLNATTVSSNPYQFTANETIFGSANSITLMANFDLTPPSFTTTVNSVTEATANLSGSVTYGGSITEYGFCWNTTGETPTSLVAGSYYRVGNGVPSASFTQNITGLTSNTLYYVWSYVVSNSTVMCGNRQTFTTLAQVTTASATNVTTYDATMGGSWATGGGATITGCGVVYGTGNTPTIGDGTSTQVAMTSPSSPFTLQNSSNLLAETTYYVRAYVTNAGGTSYGSAVSFTTLGYYGIAYMVSPAASDGVITFSPAGDGQGQGTKVIPVGTGTNASQMFPFMGSRSFDEMLYPALTIDGNAVQGDIQSISFFVKTKASGAQNPTLDIYLMETSSTTLTSGVAIPVANLCYSGTVSVSNLNDWVDITLDTPFAYQGGNLIVAIDHTGNGAYTWASADATDKSLCFMSSATSNGNINGDGQGWTENQMGQLSSNQLPNAKFTIATASGNTEWCSYGYTTTASASTLNPDYVFDHWTVDGTDVSGNTPTYTFSNITADHTITANFMLSYKRFINDGNWNVAANWSDGAVPDLTEEVAIEAHAVIPSGVIGYADNIRPITHANGSITIQDGGQLIHNNASNNMVTVTMEDTIVGYTAAAASTNKGYEIVSFPVSNLTAGSNAITGLLTGAQHPFDFYSFYASEDPLEWLHQTADSTLSLMKGYIYASQDGTTIRVTGPVMSSANDVNGTAVDFLNADAPRFNGWALLGNPFVCNAYVSLGTNNGAGAEANFYKLNHTSGYDEFVPFSSGDAVTPMGGVMFRVYDDDYIVYSRTAPGRGTGILNMDVNKVSVRGAETLDRARVRFGEGRNLEKFQFDTRHTKIYIPEGDQDFSVYYADGAGTIPVNFKAQDNGRYTLDFSTEEVGFNYLHLIDNMNGNDVDLLQTPYYTFDAKSTDFASRFTLVFATGNDNDDTFAFFNNGVWIINNDGDATLQVVDALGRMLSSENISGSTSKAINVAPGVYMLRLINGDKVKVQKIVVKR